MAAAETTLAEPVSVVAGLSPARGVVDEHFRLKPGYLPGDLIQRSDFDAIAKLLADSGAELASPEALRERIPADESFLQRELSGRSGRAFMRQLGAIPNGYAQFESLAKLPSGRRAAQQLRRQAGGADLIRYLTQTPGGARLSSQLARRTRSKPQGPPPIYTAEALSKAIDQQLSVGKP